MAPKPPWVRDEDRDRRAPDPGNAWWEAWGLGTTTRGISGMTDEFHHLKGYTA